MRERERERKRERERGGGGEIERERKRESEYCNRNIAPKMPSTNALTTFELGNTITLASEHLKEILIIALQCNELYIDKKERFMGVEQDHSQCFEILIVFQFSTVTIFVKKSEMK